MAFPSIETSNNTLRKWFALQAIVGEGPDPNTLIVEVTKWSRVFTHDTLTLEFYQKVTQFIVMGVNFIIGLLYRILLYKNVWDNGVLSRPINLMTCIDDTKIHSSSFYKH